MIETLQTLRNFFNTGKTFELEWRQTQLKNLIRMIEEQAETLAGALHKDLHKSREEAWLTETGFILHEARYALKHLKSWCRPKKAPVPIFLMPATSCIQPQPRGLALIISPWNYPVQLTFSPLIASICAGNVTLIKPSELAPAVADWCSENIPKYLDSNAFAVIQAGPEKTAQLLQNPFDFIFFTGSTKTAKHIATAAAQHLTPTVLELGGKSPCIVTHTKHIQNAARRIAFAKFINAGQTCVAPDYVLISKSLKDEFIRELKAAVVQQFGPENEPTNFTHIIHAGHFKRLSDMLGHGEKILFGGAQNEAELLFAPTIIEADAGHPVMQEEIFGPILPILTLQDDSRDVNVIDEAIQIISNHPTPLACYLFSDDKEDIKSIKRLISGGLAVNDALMHLTNVHVPFGGVGLSGHGQSHGKFGFEAFSHMRAELHQNAGIDLPLRYPPYSERIMKLIKWIMNR